MLGAMSEYHVRACRHCGGTGQERYIADEDRKRVERIAADRKAREERELAEYHRKKAEWDKLPKPSWFHELLGRDPRPWPPSYPCSSVIFDIWPRASWRDCPDCNATGYVRVPLESIPVVSEDESQNRRLA